MLNIPGGHLACCTHLIAQLEWSYMYTLESEQGAFCITAHIEHLFKWHGKARSCDIAMHTTY